MPWTGYGILVVFAVFILLMLINPKLSCFGRKISSPLYPLTRKRKQKTLKTEDYGFQLGDATDKEEESKKRPRESKPPVMGAEIKKPAKVLKTKDYGFHLVDQKDKEDEEKAEDGKKQKDD
jgi:hypothetical protein